jgi:hypothetical protein
MGLYSFLARVCLLTIVLLVSLLAVTAVADLVGASPSLLGIGPASESSLALLSNDTLVLAVGACVFVFFTAPASLALVGHAGAWLKHVVARSAKYLGVALVCACGFYLAGNAALDTTFDVGGVGHGVESVLGVVAVALVLTFLVSRTVLLKASGRLYDGFTGTGRGIRRRTIRRQSLARATVELRSMPTKQIREKEKPERIRAETIRFQRLVQTLSSTGGRVEFRLSFRDGRGRVLISICAPAGPEELQRKLLSVVKAHLSEYGAVACGDDVPAEGVGRCIPISGVPEAVENPLEPLSRYFLENGFAGDYVVVLERAPRNFFHRRAARSEQKQAAIKSGGQLTKQVPLSGDQRSAAVRDYVEEMRLEDSVKLVERHQSSLALRCWVWVTAYAESREDAELVVSGASSVIIGALSGHRAASALRVGSAREPPGPSKTCGSSTILLPSEAVPYAWIPQHAMGLQ